MATARPRNPEKYHASYSWSDSPQPPIASMTFQGPRHSFRPPQALFRRAQLKVLVDLHARDEGMGGFLTEDELSVIRGALDLSHKVAADCMTPLDKVGAVRSCARGSSKSLINDAVMC